jgi:hypothetical protein
MRANSLLCFPSYAANSDARDIGPRARGIYVGKTTTTTKLLPQNTDLVRTKGDAL